MMFRKRRLDPEHFRRRPNDRITTTEGGAGIFLVDPEGGRLYRLNQTGKAVWDALVDPISLDDLCGRLICQFSADRADIRHDVEELLHELRRAGLIEISQVPKGP